jgi:hypothetical protein
MKTRYGFVSNSSSSSFVVSKSDLSESQIQEILRPATSVEDPWNSWRSWSLLETDTIISGDTDFDNYQYSDRFKSMGIEHLVKYVR